MKTVSENGKCVQGRRFRPIITATVAALAILSVGGTQVEAGYIIAGGSSASAISADVTVAGVGVTASLNPLTGLTPGNYTTTSTLATGSAGISNVFSATTGITTTTIGTTITSGATTGSTTGTSVVNNLNLSLLGLLTITGGTLTTNSSAMGTSTGAAGSLTAAAGTGTPGITNLHLLLGIVDVTALANLQQGAFVDISASLGITLADIKIGLDITTPMGDGSSLAGITSDNLIIEISSSILGINGTIDIGQSQAFVETAAVPEPSSVAMTGVGLFLTGAFGARRNWKKRQADRDETVS